MDWNNLQDSVRNLSLYDVKAGVRKVQNAVMNYTEMESKVREATNNEPWGSSSTLMQEIANGTFNYQQLNEIMPMIYKRFTEKSAEEWRQIYKALQLMEFLIKNGSERVIDDARSHLSLLKMLRQFHYIDQNGKDQGINVRNRSKELTDLLSDVEKIRSERKKARATRNKYGGVEGGAGLGGSGPSRYGGFGSETGGASGSYGGSTRAVYGDGGGFGGERDMDYDESGSGSRRQERFDEYDEFDDGGAHARPGRRQEDASSRPKAAQKKAEAPKPKAPEVDLFDFGDEPATTAPSNNGTASDIFAAPPSASSAAMPAPTPAIGGDDDDFDDFQSAAPAAAPAQASIPKPNYSSISTAQPSFSTQYAQPTPQPGTQKADFSNLFNTTSPAQSASFSTPPPQQQKPSIGSGYQPSGPNYFTSVPAPSQAGPQTPTVASPLKGAPTATAAKKPAGGDAFASLLSGSGVRKSGASTPKGLTMADMAKQKSQAGLYGAPAAAPIAQPSAPGNKPSAGGSAMDDLLG
ncbi:ENTH-domain-containing protein [Polychaeton citri CBS 116435]|uniref:ENTH-domain-containing protein n=1 Tax=Polychaeton citri CBS 116435 TaxID=1314669 RepID=A0A9P4QD86_9PEZI|nr:ENTH-domain-containing protein [Polychaeton citri CBS 116435]